MTENCMVYLPQTSSTSFCTWEGKGKEKVKHAIWRLECKKKKKSHILITFARDHYPKCH